MTYKKFNALISRRKLSAEREKLARLVLVDGMTFAESEREVFGHANNTARNLCNDILRDLEWVERVNG